MSFTWKTVRDRVILGKYGPLGRLGAKDHTSRTSEKFIIFGILAAILNGKCHYLKNCKTLSDFGQMLAQLDNKDYSFNFLNNLEFS